MENIKKESSVSLGTKRNCVLSTKDSKKGKGNFLLSSGTSYRWSREKMTLRTTEMRLILKFYNETFVVCGLFGYQDACHDSI